MVVVVCDVQVAEARREVSLFCFYGRCGMLGGGYVLQPFFPFEEKEHDEGDDGHDAPKDKIGVAVG